MKLWIILLVYSIMCIGNASAELYQWTDENGVSHWTDVEPSQIDEFETIDEIKSKPQQQLDTSTEPPHQPVEEITPQEPLKKQPVDTKEPKYESAYLALKKIASGLKTGIGWDLLHEWLGEAGFTLDQLKKAHSDWAQNNHSYRDRCQLLIDAYECYADASSLWEARRKKNRDLTIAYIKPIAKKNHLTDIKYTLTESNYYNWIEAAKSLEQYLFKKAGSYLEKYSKM